MLYRNDSEKYQATQEVLDTGFIIKQKAPNGKVEKYVSSLTNCEKNYVITTIKLSKSNKTK